jgi:aspartyl protease family protein
MRTLLLLALLCAAVAAQAQSVTLAGRMGDRGLFMINGQPQTLAVGASANGVKLLRWVSEEAEIETGGKRLLLRVGGTPAQLGGAAIGSATREIVMTAGPGGHFTPSGSINGRPVRFLVDTGATQVAMGLDEAQRLGLDVSGSPTSAVGTANGVVPAHSVLLSRVRVGEVEVSNVRALVIPQPMPYILLGNSFLSRFQMRRDNDVMRLELR